MGQFQNANTIMCLNRNTYYDIKLLKTLKKRVVKIRIASNLICISYPNQFCSASKTFSTLATFIIIHSKNDFF